MSKAVSRKDKARDKSGKGGRGAVEGKARAKPAARSSRGAQARARSQARPAAGGVGGEKRGIARFLRDVRIELSKVTWPTRQDLLQSTIVVLVAVAIAAAFTAVADLAFSQIVEQVLKFIT